MTPIDTKDGDTPSKPYMRRSSLVLAAAFIFITVAVLVGARYGLILAVGLGFGITLEGLGFGFSGPWRAMILRRDPSGILAQLLSIGLVAILALPLIEARSGELLGAQAPIGWAMVAGAFVFGVAMQVVLGCGSGTLVNAGSGNPIGLLSLPFFAIGSFSGAYHLTWWTELGSFPIIVLKGSSGLILTLAMLATVAAVLYYFASNLRTAMGRRLRSGSLGCQSGCGFGCRFVWLCFFLSSSQPGTPARKYSHRLHIPHKYWNYVGRVSSRFLANWGI
jgi:hypothetical protein